VLDEELARKQVAERATRNREKLQAGGWWHSIDLGDQVTSGANTLEDLRSYWIEMRFPNDLSGKRVLDIGCWDGFYSFEAERHGAEVVAVDCWRPPNFFKAHEALNSKVEFRELSVYEVSRRKLGSFDIVLFLGVLYHLRHPLLGLERVCEVAKEQAIIESHVIDDFFASPRPLMEFYEGSELADQYDNWWGPSYGCLTRMTRAAGFVRTEQIRRSPARATIRAWRGWEPAALEPEPSLHISETFNPVTWEPPIPASGRRAFLGIYAKGLPEDFTNDTVRIHIGSFGVSPNFVGESEFAGYKQINAPVPLGLEPGTLSLWIEERGRRSNEVQLQLTEGTDW
jgi:tRNA (mo5U34)-methyltransferase